MIKKIKEDIKMLKKILLLGFFVLSTSTLFAQEVFWSYDESDRELIIPPDCDNTLDAEELYDVGMRLLEETGYAKQGAPYCLVAAALDGHVDAQYEVARLYHRGNLLPKSELAAYKWATLAALNGHEDANLLGANIEQFLSIADIEAATNSLTELIPTIAQTSQDRLAAEVEKQEDMKEALQLAKRDIADLKKNGRLTSYDVAPAAPVPEPTEDVVEEEVEPAVSEDVLDETQNVAETSEETEHRVPEGESILSQEDLDSAPMPSDF